MFVEIEERIKIRHIWEKSTFKYREECQDGTEVDKFFLSTNARILIVHYVVYFPCYDVRIKWNIAVCSNKAVDDSPQS
ncbi:hypothetical protein CISIN_1g034968mg [Citrus sinensis]|uniref:Uncharacterized protein n=1 Tax=Citrus sinensis TaxID=2711 RepID=A0A067E5Z2_CITSI|nr:hypothetical protein CISIN_1g034968mg [Citrus sinensis]